jgi:hypothetical protein
MSKIFELLINVNLYSAAQNMQRGRMRLAGRQFDMPDLKFKPKSMVTKLADVLD